MSVSVAHLTKTYRVRRSDPIVALDDLTLDVPDGELVVVVGPSGSGKSTLLRCVAGLERPDSGSVAVGGRDVSGVAPGERDVAMVFQEHAVYPHLSVRDNIAFGMRARGASHEDVASKVDGAAELLGLADTLDRRPGELSGGERQRVALARAIVREPAAFLMDEPLSDLDAELRTHMRAEIHRLQRRLKTSTLYVTHDQTEAMTMGDRVAVLRAGKVEQVSPPNELYDKPANTFVARFIGSPPMNVFLGSLLGATDGRHLGIRPERLRLTTSQGRLHGRVTHIENVGHESIIHIDVDDAALLARAPRVEGPIPGAEVGLDFDDDDVYVFGSDGAAR